jgi:signal transduction histidine kinase
VIANELRHEELGAKRRVLVVDDDRDFAESLHNFLLLEGYDVEMAFSAEQAQSAVNRFDAQVAILDYRLGPVIGLDLVAPLKRRRPELICILATAFGDMASVVKALRSGIYDYFGKPLNTDQLLATLDRCFERLQLEQDKQAAQAALREARQMEAVGQIAGGVAHHFNNLLMVMLGNVERLKVRLADDPDQIELADNLLRAIERAAEINQSLVTFTRRQVLRPTVVDLNALLTGMQADIGQAVGEAVQVQLVASPDLWPVWADAAQFKAVLLNLARNAGEAMPNGGRLIVTTTNTDVPAAKGAREQDPSPGKYTVIAISDNGTGMAPEIAARAFEPFFSGRGLADKVGLGLSVVYGFAKQSVGTVTIDSNEGQGTTVRIYLPRAQGREHQGEVRSAYTQGR